MVVLQAWIGRVVVEEQMDTDLVSVRLAISLTAGAKALWAIGRRRRRPAHEVTMLGLAALL